MLTPPSPCSRRRSGSRVSAIVAAAIGLGSSFAHDSFGAEPGTVDVRLGAAGVFFDSSAKLSIAGQRLQGASAQATDNATAILELGVYVLPNLSAMLSLGIPPVSKFVGTGTAAAFGPLG